MNDVFVRLAAHTADDLRPAIDLALAIRAAAPARAFLEARAADIDAADFAALLEWIEPQGEEYRFVLVVRNGGVTWLATSTSIRKEDDQWLVGEPGDVRVYDIGPDSRARTLADDLETARFVDGVGGRTGVFDGATDLLTLRTAVGTAACILHGYEYRVFSGDPTVPASDPDVARYAAIDAVFVLLTAVLEHGPTPIETVPIAAPR